MKFEPKRMASARRELTSRIGYGKKLVSTGLEGANAGRRRALDRPGQPCILCSAYKTAALGTVAGILAGVLTRREKLARSAAVGGALGGALGFSSGVIWGFKHAISEAMRGAATHVGHTRDQRWLETHPINYA